MQIDINELFAQIGKLTVIKEKLETEIKNLSEVNERQAKRIQELEAKKVSKS